MLKAKEEMISLRTLLYRMAYLSICDRLPVASAGGLSGKDDGGDEAVAFGGVFEGESALQVTTHQRLHNAQAQPVRAANGEAFGQRLAIVGDGDLKLMLALLQGDVDAPVVERLKAMLHGVLHQFVEDQRHRGRLVEAEDEVVALHAGADALAGWDNALLGGVQNALGHLLDADRIQVVAGQKLVDAGDGQNAAEGIV